MPVSPICHSELIALKLAIWLARDIRRPRATPVAAAFRGWKNCDFSRGHFSNLCPSRRNNSLEPPSTRVQRRPLSSPPNSPSLLESCSQQPRDVRTSPCRQQESTYVCLVQTSQCPTASRRPASASILAIAACNWARLLSDTVLIDFLPGLPVVRPRLRRVLRLLPPAHDHHNPASSARAARV